MSRRAATARRLASGLIAGLTIAYLIAPAPAGAEDRVAPGAADAARQESEIVERWRAATPGERREMRSRLRERWQDATPRARRRFGRGMKALERKLPDFSAIERLVILRAAARMPAPEREALKRRIAGIDDLEAAERAKLTAELRAMIDAYSPEVDRLERNTRRWKEMSPAERDEVREQMRRLREMSVEERRALLEEMERSRREP